MCGDDLAVGMCTGQGPRRSEDIGVLPWLNLRVKINSGYRQASLYPTIFFMMSVSCIFF